MLAASQAEGPLSEDQIDELLGVAPDDAHDAAEPAGRDSLEAGEGEASA